MAFTVRDLRRALEGVPDDTPVAHADECWYREPERAGVIPLRASRDYETGDWRDPGSNENILFKMWGGPTIGNIEPFDIVNVFVID